MKKLGLALGLLFWATAALAQVVTTKEFPQGSQTANLTASNTFTTGTATAHPYRQVRQMDLHLRLHHYHRWHQFRHPRQRHKSPALSLAPLNFEYAFVSSGQGILGVAFPGCISSSAVNTSIVVNVPAGGAGTVGAVNAWGYTN